VAESHEPSYYEIALTNRQVVVAFIILLVCLLSAFFSGVWIGREGTAARVASAAEDQIRDTPPEAPKEGQNLEELAFFDDRNPDPTAGDETEKTVPGGTPPQPPADSTLVEEVTGDFGEDEPAAAPAQGDENLTRAERRARRREAREAAEKAKAAAAAKLARAEETPAPARASRSSEPSVPKGSVVIQVFSSPDKAQADRIRSQLAGGGYTAYLSPVEKAGHTMYRVRLGPFGSREDAQKVAEKVRKGYKLDTWVTE
jgi:cell division protein FtsN